MDTTHYYLPRYLETMIWDAFLSPPIGNTTTNCPTTYCLSSNQREAFHQLSFFPTNPPRFKPMKQITTTLAALTKMVQNAARNPSIKAILWSFTSECSVTDAAMAAVTARPTEFPNCDTSLNTPPASDCVSTGNASEMTMFDTVKRTVLTSVAGLKMQPQAL